MTWKKIKTINPYIPHSWVNKKKMQMLEVHYDIGFGKQRNTTIYNLRKQGLSGFKPIKTYYGKSSRDALAFARKWMKK